MESLDDYFEYAMDLPEAQRGKLLAQLRADDPALAARLEKALAEQVKNPDFVAQTAPRPPRPGEPDRLKHVTLQVDDTAKASRWYVEVFRCRLVRQDAERVVIAFGEVEVHLVQRDVAPPSLTLLRRDVASMGPSQRRADGVRGLHLVDPWGNVIEVVDGPTPAPPDRVP